MTTETTQFQREINEQSDELQQRQRGLLQPVPARYYNFLGEDGQREANMIVLLDGQGRAMQAELHYDRTLPNLIQNKVRRQAEWILTTRYLGSGPTTSLYVFEFGEQLTRVDVTNTGEDAQAGPEGSVNLLYVALGILGMFLVVGLLFWLLNSLFRDRQELAAATATPVVMAQPAADAAAASAAVAPAVTADPLAPGMVTNDLPPSTRANPAIGLGTTVRIREGLRSFVRSEPGSEAGEVAGYLQNGETAVVVGGPTWLKGDTDTIVWWYVQLPDGTRGWTPANTSQFTLLDPAN
jgi:hypothetical protein